MDCEHKEIELSDEEIELNSKEIGLNSEEIEMVGKVNSRKSQYINKIRKIKGF